MRTMSRRRFSRGTAATRRWGKGRRPLLHRPMAQPGLACPFGLAEWRQPERRVYWSAEVATRASRPSVALGNDNNSISNNFYNVEQKQQPKRQPLLRGAPIASVEPCMHQRSEDRISRRISGGREGHGRIMEGWISGGQTRCAGERRVLAVCCPASRDLKRQNSHLLITSVVLKPRTIASPDCP